MKKIFLLSLIFLCLTLWSQSGKSVIYLFGTNDVTIEETDLGQYKEYTIQCKVTSEDVNETPKKEVFTVYNNETPMFNERFIDAYYKLQASDTNIKKDTQAIFNEARVVYMRMRNEETNKALFDEYSFSPVAGILIVEDNVTIQQVNPRQQRLIKDLQKSRWRKLQKNDSIRFSVYNNIDGICDTPQEKTNDTSPKKQANPDSSWSWVYIKRYPKQDSIHCKLNLPCLRVNIKQYNKQQHKRIDKYYKYTETEHVSCTEKQPIAGKTAFYYQKKRYVKKRILALIVDSIQSKEKLEISMLQSKMLGLKTGIHNKEYRIDSLTHEIKTHTIKLNKKQIDKKALNETNNGTFFNLINENIIDSLNRDFLTGNMKFDYFNRLFDSLISTNTTNYRTDTLISLEHKSLQEISKKLKSEKDNRITKELELEKINEEIETIQDKNQDERRLIDRQNLIEKNKKKADIGIDLSDIDSRIAKYTHLSVIIKNAVTERLKYNFQISNNNIDTINEVIISLKDKLMKESDIVKQLTSSFRRDKNQFQQYCNSYFEQVRRQIGQQFDVDSIQIEFNDGSIENIQVLGTLKADSIHGCPSRTFEALKFTNQTPFGFTSKREIELLNKRWLYTGEKNGYVYTMNVGNLFKDYIEKYEVDRRDFSPRNEVVVLKRNDPKSYDRNFRKYYRTLHKEYSTDILTGTVYTDLNGLSGDEPNGIIQTEFYQDLAINKNRYWFKNSNKYVVNQLNLNIRKVSANWSFLTYITPHFVLSKIENTNKYLDLSSKEITQNGITDTLFYASTIDLRKHESFRVGIHQNLLLLDIPTAKSTFFLDYNFYWGRVPVRKNFGEQNTDNNYEFNADAIEHGPSIAFELFTDERYGLRLSLGHSWYYVMNSNFYQVGDSRSYDQNNEREDMRESRSGYWKADFLAFLKPKSDGKGKIFFRYNFFTPSEHWDLSWSQVQFGYAFSLTQTKIPDFSDKE